MLLQRSFEVMVRLVSKCKESPGDEVSNLASACLGTLALYCLASVILSRLDCVSYPVNGDYLVQHEEQENIALCPS